MKGSFEKLPDHEDDKNQQQLPDTHIANRFNENVPPPDDHPLEEDEEI